MEEIDGPIRSRFRGLSWDKKHQGWRVRIYYSGKQRHVGRFEDDVAAAKAYDKAAVYLYGANAITNFGIQACQEDPTEVSPFIVLAKEQADQEQQARSQQRHQQFGVQQLSDMYAAAGASPLMMLPNGTPSINMGGSTANTASPGAPAAGIMSPQHLDATAVSSFPALAATLHQQQGQGQAVPLLLQQVVASNAAQAPHQDQGVAITAGCTQPLQQQLLLLTGSQPLQLSVQPQLTTMAGHLNMHQQALQQAQQPLLLVQHPPQQQVQLVGLPNVSLDPQPAMGGSNPLALRATSQTAVAALVGNGTGCSTAAEQLPRPDGAGLSLLPTSANAGLVVNGMACSSTDSFVEDMLQGLGYPSAMLSGGTAAMHHQQAAGPMLQHQQLMANGMVVSVTPRGGCLGFVVPSPPLGGGA
eukprot:gene2096-2414_t